MIFWTLIAVVALAPLPLGAVYAWTWGLMGCAVGVLLVAWSVAVAMGKVPVRVGLRKIWFIVLLFGLAAGWAALQASPITPSPWHHPLWRSAASALGVDVAAAVSLNPFETGSALLRLLTYAGVFWLALQYCRDGRRARQTYYALAVAGLAYAGYGLMVQFSGANMILWYEKTSHGGSLTSTFVNRNSYATYAGLTLLCASGLLIKLISDGASSDLKRRERLRIVVESISERGWIFLIAWIAIATALFLTQSRGGFMGAAIGLITLLIAVSATRIMKLHHAAALGFLVLGAGIAFFVVSGEGTARRLAQTSVATEARVKVFELTSRAVGDAPVLGTGYGTFEDVFQMYRDDRLYKRVDKAENTYLENALELGVPAAAALFAAIGTLFAICLSGVRRRRRDAIYPCIGVAATAMVAVQSVVEFSLQIPAVAVTYSLMMGAACAQSWSSRERL